MTKILNVLKSQRFNRGVLIISPIILIILGFWSLGLQRQSNRNDHELRHTLTVIQLQRIEATWGGCFQTDTRNADFRDQLNRGLIGTPTKVAAETKAFTLPLVEAAIPYTDCTALLRQRFGQHTSYPPTLPAARSQWHALQARRTFQLQT